VGPSPPDECADLSVAPVSIPRALRLMDALFRALERRGFPVTVRDGGSAQEQESRVRCTILGEEFEIRLREKLTKARRSERDRLRDPSIPSTPRRKPRLKPKGVLVIDLLNQSKCVRQSWSDDGGGLLEGRLNDVVLGLLIEVQRNRWLRTEAARRREERDLAWRGREKEERLRQVEQVRVARLEGAAEGLQKAQRLRVFIEAVREEALRRHGRLEDLPGVSRWLEWAEGHARSIDPLGPDKPLPRIDVPGDPPPPPDVAPTSDDRSVGSPGG
jgi:hypothetical protein